MIVSHFRGWAVDLEIRSKVMPKVRPAWFESRACECGASRTCECMTTSRLGQACRLRHSAQPAGFVQFEAVAQTLFRADRIAEYARLTILDKEAGTGAVHYEADTECVYIGAPAMVTVC